MSDVQCKACEQEHPDQRCPVVEEEIAARRSADPSGFGFIGSEWRKHRMRGLKPSEIDYDMCHVFR